VTIPFVLLFIIAEKLLVNAMLTSLGWCIFITLVIIIPNRTFLVRFGGISGEFGRAMVRILARRSRAKIPMVRTNELDMLPKRTKKGAIRYLPYPNSS